MNRIKTLAGGEGGVAGRGGGAVGVAAGGAMAGGYIEMENREVAMDAANNQSFRLRRWGAETLMRAMSTLEREWPSNQRAGDMQLEARTIANAIGDSIDVDMMQDAPADGGPESLYYAWLLHAKQQYILAIFARAAAIVNGEGRAG